MIDTTVPLTFISGETITWEKNLPDYLPVDNWVLTYVFVIGGDQQVVTATDAGNGSHSATITKTISNKFTSGIYTWQAHVDNGTDHIVVDSGRVEVKPNFLDQENGFDARSHVKQVLDALEATILKKASKDQMSYTVGSTTVSRMTPEELLKWQNHYRILYNQELQVENISNGNMPSNKGQVRF